MGEVIKQDNRERILKCAQNLFYSKGYDAVGVQEIVDTAGITKPTMYYYFRSKHGLLESLLEENGSAFIKKLRKAAEFKGEFSAVLKHVMKTYLSVAIEHKEFYFLMIGLYSSARDNESYKAVKPYMAEQFWIIKQLFIREGKENTYIRGKEEQLAISFTGTMNYYILVFFESEGKKEELLREDTIDSMIKQLLQGIYYKKNNKIN